MIERFRRDCAAALGRPVAGERLALAVSGGPDSMAMLVLAHGALPGATVAATVDHRLRPAASEEAAMVARCCMSLGIPHATLAPDRPVAGASIQAQAREARYRLLRDWALEMGASALLTAHHADDQAETLLMRAARGSGIAGLAGIRRTRDVDGLMLIRPLLGWRRAELRGIAEQAGAPFVDDPTNADEAHDRTRFRRLIEATPWLDAGGIARAAAHAGEAEAALGAVTRLLWTERARRHEARWEVDVAGLPRELRRRLARRAIGEVRRMAEIATPAWSDAANIEPLLDSLDAGLGGTQAGVLASTKGACWAFRAAPARRSH